MKRYLRAWWKKALVSLVLAVVLAVALEFLQVKTQPPYYEYRETGISHTETLSDPGQEIPRNYLSPYVLNETGGSELFFVLPDALEMNRVRVVLEGPAAENAYFRVYCIRTGEGDPTVNMAEGNCLKGTPQMDFWFPRGAYSQVGVKINGKADIREVRAETAEAEKVLIPGSMLKRRMVLLAVLCFIVSMILWAVHGWTRLRGCFRAAKQGILEDRRKTAINALIFLGSGGIAWLILRLYLPYLLGKPYNFLLNIFSLLAAAGVGCLFCFRKTLGRKPEVFFLVLCLLIGSCFTFLYPAVPISWDEEFHASNAITYSYLGSVRYSAQDDYSLTSGRNVEKKLSYFGEETKAQNERYNQGITSWRNGFPESKNFWTFFGGIGFYIGRVLKLPYHWIWSLGRFFGLLAYAVIGYFAVRRLKTGKMILAAVLLIPECVFLTSTFSYDAGVIVFTALGMSYLVREWQEPEKKLEWKNAFLMIGALFAGCYAKAIYFPLLLLPLFLRKGKFTGLKQRRLYMGLSAGALVLLVASFAVPFVLSPDGGGDIRGGENVNSFGQVQFILSNPLQYTGILLNFLGEYLNPDGFYQFLTFLAYLGEAPHAGLYLILLTALAFTDRDGKDLDIPGKTGSRACMLAVLFGTVVLIATSMYVSYTPVGFGTINGCQHRYLLPLFFPAMMLICPGKIRNDVNKTLYNGIFFALIGFVGFSAALVKCAGLYV